MKNTTNGNGNGKPKVVLLHYSGPPIVSGVELVLRDQARLFRLFNYKVEIVVGTGKQFRKDIPLHTINKMSSTNKQVLTVRNELKQNKLSPLFSTIEHSIYKSLKKYFLQSNPKVCIVHNVLTRHYNLPLTAALIRLSKELTHITFISWVHDTTFSDTSYFKIDPALQEQYPWSLLVTPQQHWIYVCISEFRKKELLQTFKGEKPKSLSVIPNGIDIDKFLELSPQVRDFYKHIGRLEADLIACTPVRLVRRKNLELGIKVAHEMVKKGINYKYVITGSTDQHQENATYFTHLKELVKSLNLEKNVFFLTEFLQSIEPSYVNSQIQIREIYQISDFLLMTSSIEGFGLPLLEAGLARTPIFASDIKPFHEIGTTNINYFSLTTPPEKIAQQILRRLDELPQSYFYRKVIKNYSIRRIFKNQIIPLVESITKA